MALTGEAPFGLLAVGGGGRPPPMVDAAAAEAWWQVASFGHWRPRAVLLPPVELAADPARWCAGGGMGPGPRNAAALVRAALLALPCGTDCPPGVVVVVAAPVAPHAWRVAEGGVPLAPGRWVRRYAALPERASLGAWVHELAHLLLDWPDLPGSPCLMGQGAARAFGRDPAPPGPALALAAGWLVAHSPTATEAASDLGPGAAVALDWHGCRLLITRYGEELAIHDQDRPGPPLAIGRIADPDAPLLASAAAALARIADHPRAAAG